MTGETPSRVQRAAVTTESARNSKRDVSVIGPEVCGFAASQMPRSDALFAVPFAVLKTRVASAFAAVSSLAPVSVVQAESSTEEVKKKAVTRMRFMRPPVARDPREL